MNAISEIRSEPPRCTPRVSKPDPHKRLVELAVCLASPVARGLLTENHAKATLLASALCASRTGTIDVDPVHEAHILIHILYIYVRNLAERRALAKSRIHETVADMFDAAPPLKRLLAESHNCNGDIDFPLREWEVTEVVGIELAAAMRAEEGAHA